MLYCGFLFQFTLGLLWCYIFSENTALIVVLLLNQNEAVKYNTNDTVPLTRLGERARNWTTEWRIINTHALWLEYASWVAALRTNFRTRTHHTPFTSRGFFQSLFHWEKIQLQMLSSLKRTERIFLSCEIMHKAINCSTKSEASQKNKMHIYKISTSQDRRGYNLLTKKRKIHKRLNTRTLEKLPLNALQWAWLRVSLLFEIRGCPCYKL